MIATSHDIASDKGLCRNAEENASCNENFYYLKYNTVTNSIMRIECVENFSSLDSTFHLYNT